MIHCNICLTDGAIGNAKSLLFNLLYLSNVFVAPFLSKVQENFQNVKKRKSQSQDK
jgi:hypothetical protein